MRRGRARHRSRRARERAPRGEAPGARGRGGDPRSATRCRPRLCGHSPRARHPARAPHPRAGSQRAWRSSRRRAADRTPPPRGRALRSPRGRSLTWSARLRSAGGNDGGNPSPPGHRAAPRAPAAAAPARAYRASAGCRDRSAGSLRSHRQRDRCAAVPPHPSGKHRGGSRARRTLRGKAPGSPRRSPPRSGARGTVRARAPAPSRVRRHGPARTGAAAAAA